MNCKKSVTLFMAAQFCVIVLSQGIEKFKKAVLDVQGSKISGQASLMAGYLENFRINLLTKNALFI